jgi:hypothetical protein
VRSTRFRDLVDDAATRHSVHRQQVGTCSSAAVPRMALARGPGDLS